MFLVDTDILSALRRRERQPGVVKWVDAQRTVDLHLSVITIGEVERGIPQQRRRDPTFAEDLARWLDRVLGWYGERILPVNLSVARGGGSSQRPSDTEGPTCSSPPLRWSTA